MISDAEALLIATLALDAPVWVHRRVEQITYLDDRSVRRRISVDFTTPPFWSHDGPLHVPIAQFVKRPLTRFGFVSESGEPLPMLTKEQNGQISTQVLRGLARVPDAPLVDQIVDKYIEVLVYSTKVDERDEALRKIFQGGTRIGRTLTAFTPFRALAYEMARNFVLYMPIPSDARGDRRIVKLSFDRGEPVARPRGPAEWLGARSVQDGFYIPAAGLAASYHVELVPPPEMRFAAATFFGTRQGQTVTSPVYDRLTPAAHLNLSGLDRIPGYVAVASRVDSAVLTGAALFAMLSAAALWFVLARLQQFAAQQSGDAVVAALLAVPGIALAYIIRPSEHAVAAAFLRAFRILALMAATTSFAGAMVLFAGYSEDTLYRIFRVLVALSTISAVGLVGSWAVQARSSSTARRAAP